MSGGRSSRAPHKYSSRKWMACCPAPDVQNVRLPQGYASAKGTLRQPFSSRECLDNPFSGFRSFVAGDFNPRRPAAKEADKQFYSLKSGRSGVTGYVPAHILALFLIFFLSACNLTNSPVEITPEPTPDLPRVQILQPANNQQVIEGTEFTFDVVARDENPGIASVELRIDGVTQDQIPPAEDEFVPVLRAEIPWRASGIGLHVIEAIAYRPDGTPSDTAIINIEVVPRE